MAVTVEEIAARLSAEAARRGITTEQLLDELAAQTPALSDGQERSLLPGWVVRVAVTSRSNTNRFVTS